MMVVEDVAQLECISASALAVSSAVARLAKEIIRWPVTSALASRVMICDRWCCCPCPPRPPHRLYPHVVFPNAVKGERTSSTATDRPTDDSV